MWTVMEMELWIAGIIVLTIEKKSILGLVVAEFQTAEWSILPVKSLSRIHVRQEICAMKNVPSLCMDTSIHSSVLTTSVLT